MKKEKITEEEIEEMKTANGGWTREILAIWGVPWPPPKGCKSALLQSGLHFDRIAC